MDSQIPAEELVAALDATAADTLWEAGVEGPPVDAALIAERLGLVVAQDHAMPGRGRFARLALGGSTVAAQGTIVVGPAERPERLQWAIAHEIGESMAHRVFATLGVCPAEATPAAREQVANHLASCLLLPRRWFAADGHAFDWDLYRLKHRYATASHELIARRMLEMRPPIVITLCDQGHVQWRRSNMVRRPPPLLPEEERAWRNAHRTGEPAVVHVDGATRGLESVCAWPVHEPDWKREILRSAIVDW